jgi:hypothetical protein
LLSQANPPRRETRSPWPERAAYAAGGAAVLALLLLLIGTRPAAGATGDRIGGHLHPALHGQHDLTVVQARLLDRGAEACGPRLDQVLAIPVLDRERVGSGRQHLPRRSVPVHSKGASESGIGRRCTTDPAASVTTSSSRSARARGRLHGHGRTGEKATGISAEACMPIQPLNCPSPKVA